MQTADSTQKATLLSYFPERIQAALKAYAAEVALSPEAVVELAIGYFLESADINVDTGDQDAPSIPSHQTVLAHLPLPLQKGIEQYAAEIEFPPEAVVELAVTFLLDPDATSFEDCQIGVQREQVYLLQQYREAHQAEAA
ncbi:hypothetical protein [Leptolyngbya sp. FACHB-711]|uniref:hypothetical protein n=1 Tax=Leptolyngbya sp. FACHB-711 TaxID=2692813 RepID=UPI001682075C|nr:hypothetical protein [Leptolyngbya sp. FACHB-711]MBD2023797.1 hypothetical protein [Leptolyngbya sp. FACHB-711]